MKPETFRKIRTRTGVTALELSRKSRIAPSRISLFESGVIGLNVDQVATLTICLATAIEARASEFLAAIEILKGGDGAPDFLSDDD